MTSLGIQTLTQMVTQVGRHLNDPSVARQVQIKDSLNSWYLFAAEQRMWDQLIDVDETGLRNYNDTTVKTFETDDARTPAPWNALRIKAFIFQDVAQPDVMMVEPSDLYERAGSQLNTTGAPAYGCVVGRTAQWRPVPANGTVSFVSGSVNASAVVRVHYRTSTAHVGVPSWEDLSANDWTTGDVTSVALKAGWPIERISLPSTWVGDLNGVQSGTNVVAIQRMHQPITTTDSSYQIADRLLIRVWPVPDSDYPMTVIYQRIPQRMTEDGDQPAMPISDFLIYKATATIKRLQGDLAGAANFEAEANAAWAGTGQSGTARGAITIKPVGRNILGMTGTTSWRP